MMLALLFLVFFALLVLRVPVGVSLSLSALLMIFIEGLNPVNLVTQSYQMVDSFALMAIPFFLVIGMILAKTSLAHRLLDLADLVVGRLRGGVGYANVASSMMTGGVSGSATADVASLGTVLIPMMRKKGYSAAYAAALTAASSTMSVILPPSVVLIVYGSFVNTSIGALFMAGILPGVCMGLVIMLVNFLHVRRRGIDLHQSNVPLLQEAETSVLDPVMTGVKGEEESLVKQTPFLRGSPPGLGRILPRLGHVLQQAERPVAGEERHWYKTVVRGGPILLVPLIVVFGVRGGVFTATEAGAIALIYLLVLVLVLYRELTWRRAKTISTEAVILYSQVLFAIVGSGAFGWVLSLLGASQVVQELVDSVNFTSGTYLLMVVLVFTVIGTFLDATPAVIIFAPLFSAGAAELGIHPVHLGIVVVMVLGIGMITPPYGLALLLASRLAGVTLWEGTKAMLPFWLACYTVIAAFAMSESLALQVPRVLAPALF